MAKIIIVGCRLPHGLMIHNPLDPEQKVTLNGLNKTKIIGATYATTEVDAEFWETWKAAHEGSFAPLDSGAIFEARSATEAADKAKELVKEKTGLEPLAPDANGVKPVDKE